MTSLETINTVHLQLQVKNDVIGYYPYTPATAVVHQGHLSLLNTSVNFSFASVDFKF